MAVKPDEAMRLAIVCLAVQSWADVEKHNLLFDVDMRLGRVTITPIGKWEGEIKRRKLALLVERANIMVKAGLSATSLMQSVLQETPEDLAPEQVAVELLKALPTIHAQMLARSNRRIKGN